MFSVQDHHRKGDVCHTRPPYRNGRKLRAVKTYTIAQESKYLLIQNIPSIGGNLEQLLPYLNEYGPVEQHWRLDDYESKPFSDTILVRYEKIEHARRCKFYFDDWNFLGENLHICYAPECENVADLREKMAERRAIVQHKAQLNAKYRRKDLPRTTNGLVSSKRTLDEVRTRIRDVVEKSNLVAVFLQQEVKKRKRVDL